MIERSFDASVDVLWQMWTDPERFAAWYGPDGAADPGAASRSVGVAIPGRDCRPGSGSVTGALFSLHARRDPAPFAREPRR